MFQVERLTVPQPVGHRALTVYYIDSRVNPVILKKDKSAFWKHFIRLIHKNGICEM